MLVRTCNMKERHWHNHAGRVHRLRRISRGCQVLFHFLITRAGTSDCNHDSLFVDIESRGTAYVWSAIMWHPSTVRRICERHQQHLDSAAPTPTLSSCSAENRRGHIGYDVRVCGLVSRMPSALNNVYLSKHGYYELLCDAPVCLHDALGMSCRTTAHCDEEAVKQGSPPSGGERTAALVAHLVYIMAAGSSVSTAGIGMCLPRPRESTTQA